LNAIARTLFSSPGRTFCEKKLSPAIDKKALQQLYYL